MRGFFGFRLGELAVTDMDRQVRRKTGKLAHPDIVLSPIPKEIWHWLATSIRLGRPFQKPLSEADRKIVWLDVERNARRKTQEARS